MVALACIAGPGSRLAVEPVDDVGGPFVLEEDFDYEVDRTGPHTNFTSEGIFSAVKAATNSGTFLPGGGFIYTADTFEGEAAPGGGKWCVFEGHPEEFDPATLDFYLQIGDEPGSYGDFPNDAWLQFWFMMPAGQDWATDCKFWYPNGSTTLGNEGIGILVCCNHTNLADPGDHAPEDEIVFGIRAEGANYTLADPGDEMKLFQNVNLRSIAGGVPYLVRQHFRTTASGARWQYKHRTLVEGSMTTLADWQDGVTANFSWEPTDNAILGPAKFRIPTVMDSSGALNFAIANLRMAESEDALPDYL